MIFAIFWNTIVHAELKTNPQQMMAVVKLVLCLMMACEMLVMVNAVSTIELRERESSFNLSSHLSSQSASATSTNFT